jgi:hypothetical protein
MLKRKSYPRSVARRDFPYRLPLEIQGVARRADLRRELAPVH